MKALLIVATSLVTALAAASPAQGQGAGYALRFDGTTDYVRLHATSSMMAPSWPTTKTVSVWVNPTGTSVCTSPSPGSCDSIFGDRPRSWGISRGTINGEDRIWIWNYDGSFDRVGVEYTTETWTQITLVHVDGVLSAYKDGAFVGSIASGATVENAGGQVLYIGGIINNATRNWTFEGDIDEVQIWNVARSDVEIAQSMSGPLTGTEAGLAAYYRMTNGSGTVVTDDSDSEWTGMLLDGTSDVPGNGPVDWVDSGAFGVGPTIPNTQPTADAQSVTTAEDTPAFITLTGADADDNPLTFRVTHGPAHGVLTGSVPHLTYTPWANFNGDDSFVFVANDGRVDSTPAVVAISITAVNDPPAAGNDTASTPINTPLLIQVLANDTDIEGNPLTITEITEPQFGAASNEVVEVRYTPIDGFTGTDSFTYTITDGLGGFTTATVTITVRPPGADPGLALQFDGVSDYVTLARTADVMGTGWETTKTVGLWVKPEGTPYCLFADPASCDAIFGDRPRWWGISRGVINGVDRIWVWNSGGDTFSAHSVGVPYTAGEWVHITLVHGGGVLSAYKNGVLVGSVSSGPTQQPPGAPVLHLGGVINTASRNWTFQGAIDEVQIWNTARTADEIRQDMMQPLIGTELGLAAYYRMSDGSGTLLTDDSGHGFNGTLWDGGNGVPADGPILWVPSHAFSVTPPQ